MRFVYQFCSETNFDLLLRASEVEPLEAPVKKGNAHFQPVSPLLIRK